MKAPGGMMSSAQTPPEKPSQQQIAALTGSFRAGRHAEALELARTLASQFPTSLAAWNIRGAAARALGSLDEAEASFRQLETLDPGFAGAPYNLGLTLQDLGRNEEAVAAYRRALALDPQLAQAHNNLGNLLTRLGELDAAIAHLETARGLRPDLPEIHNSLGNALKRAGRFDDALAAYLAALKTAPGFAKALYNAGVLWMERGETDDAIAAFRKSLTVEPGNELARLQLAYLLAQDCDWDGLDAMSGNVCDLGVTTPGVPPWPLLALEDSPERQLQRARSWGRRIFGEPQPAALPARPKARPERLRIGYFSADYHDHPGARLLNGMIRHHDRDRFEAHAFSYGPRRNDPYRRDAEAIFDGFHDVLDHSDAQIIELARSLDLHIAIDRQGYTVDSRTRLFRHRLAPVHVGYLGYPSTRGVDFVEYLVADPVVVPAAQRAHYSESLISLPYTYMPCDNRLPIAPDGPARADHGLPEHGFVFCCFNATYKITRREFEIWMRLLEQVEGSVLWLFRSTPAVTRNLRSHAAGLGIDPDRLVFADRVPAEQHLERHRHADLFLDTFCMNAHTTTVDALWAHLPAITRVGEQLAARVAASLLYAANLSELVTHMDAEYEALALELATDPARLAAVRAKLAANRLASPLFDTQAYTRHFEAGMDMAYDRFMAGLPPADIVIPA